MCVRKTKTTHYTLLQCVVCVRVCVCVCVRDRDKTLWCMKSFNVEVSSILVSFKCDVNPSIYFHQMNDLNDAHEDWKTSKALDVSS